MREILINDDGPTHGILGIYTGVNNLGNFRFRDVHDQDMEMDALKRTGRDEKAP